MKKLGKILLIVFSLLILAIAGGLSYLKFALPNIKDAENLSIKASEDLIQEGDYLANHVMVCMDCHSKRDWTKYSGPIIQGTLGQGGETFDQKMGFPGRFVAKNITPYALASWTDGEIMRAITTGITKDDQSLFPLMPYTHYGTLDKDDIIAIIAYLRQLEPIEKDHQPAQLDFPMNFIINTIPQEAQFVDKPTPTDQVNYGQYLVNASACYDCHTQQEKGQFIGEDFAGGMVFSMKDGSIIRSPNITPHKKSGIGSWTEDQFVQRFKMYTDSAYTPHNVAKGDMQTVMPWTMYGGMKEEDLQAIYHYLKTLTPIDNSVVRFSPPAE